MPSTRVRPALRSVVCTCLLSVLVLSTAGVAGPATAAAAHDPVDGATARSSCTAPGAAVVGSPPGGEVAALPDEARDTDVALGDLAVVPLSVPDGGTATVTVAGGEYQANLTVRDDGDGVVRLVVNTYLAAEGSDIAPGTYRARGEDTVSVRGGNATGPLTEGRYAVTVRHDGSAVDEQELTVTEPAVNDVTALRAVPRVFEAGTATELRQANRSGLIGPLAPGEHAPSAVMGETVVLRLDAPSLLGALSAQPGNTTTERFLALHDRVGPETAETFHIYGVCGGIMFADTVAAGGARVVAGHRQGVVYVLFDTSSLRGVTDGKQSVFLELDESSPVAESERRLEAEFEITDREVSVDAGRTVQLSVDGPTTVRGETNLMPGSRVAVVVESRLDPPHEQRTTVYVRANGSFAATVDVPNASAPGLYAVSIAGTQFPAEVGDPPSVHWALEQRYVGSVEDELAVERLWLPDGGFLVAYAYNRSTGALDRVGIATPSDEELAIDRVEESQYLLVVAHRDDGDDGWFQGPSTDPPYRVDGRAVADWVGVRTVDDDLPSSPPDVPVEAALNRTVTSETPTPTSAMPTTTEPPTTGTTTTEETPTTDRPTTTVGTTAPATGRTATSTGPDASGTTVPGFGLLATAVALVGALLLVRRRR